MPGTFDVDLVVDLPPGAGRADVVAAISAIAAPFTIEVEPRGERSLLLRCSGVPHRAGLAPIPEALRIAQTGLSLGLRGSVPVYTERGGLLWSDVTSVRVEAKP